MKHSFILFFITFCTLLAWTGCFDTVGVNVGNVSEKRGPLPIGSSTKDWVIETKGGDGGKVIAVTTLNLKGPGSITEAFAAKGPRKIVFKVGGVIDLGAESLYVTNPHVTLDGSTAPEPGITFIRGGLGIATHDVIFRHIRVRVGEAGYAKRSGWETDGITLSSAYNVIVENCSVSWYTDEGISASGPRFGGNTPEEWRANTSHDIIFRNNIIAEGLSHTTHSEKEHSKGTLIHDNVTKVAIIGNLYASNTERNPFTKGGSTAIIANNVINNPGRWAIHYALNVDEWKGRTPLVPGVICIVGNVIQFGPNTPKTMPVGIFIGRSELYVHDNKIIRPQLANAAIPWVGQFTELSEPPFWLNGYKAIPSSDTLESVLKNVGARPWSRDPVDKRIVEETRTRKGRIIDSENEAEGYPPYTMK